jgi:hypothetical protein
VCVDSATPHHNAILTPQRHSTQHHNAITPQRYNATTPQRHNVTTPQHHNVTTSQHHDVTTPQAVSEQFLESVFGMFRLITLESEQNRAMLADLGAIHRCIAVLRAKPQVRGLLLAAKTYQLYFLVLWL